MATDLHYNADPLLAGPLAHGAGFGRSAMERQQQLEAIAQQQAQMAQQAGMQDQRLRYQAEIAAAQLDQQRDLSLAGMANQQYLQQQGAANQYMLEELNQQGQLNYAAAQGSAQAYANQANAAGQMAKQIQESQLQQALNEHDAMMKAQMSGEFFTSDEQIEQAWNQWEAKWADYGFRRGLPDMVAAQAAQQEQEVELQRWKAMLEAPDGSGELIAPPAMAEALMRMDPEKALPLIPKMQAEYRQIKKLGIDKEMAEAERKDKESETAKKYADIEADNVRAQQEMQNDQQKAQQELEFNQLKQQQQLEMERQKARQQARLAFQKANQTWSAAKGKKGPDGQPAGDPGPQPKWEDFDPGFDELDDGQPKLKPGESIVTNPKGRRAILHANGTVTPLD